MKLSSLTLIVFVFLTVGCNQDPVIEPVQEEILINTQYPNADQRLWSYFEAFELAAKARGLVFNLRDLNILGVIERIEEDGVAGHCKYGSHIDNEVTIDSEFWSQASDLYREFVVFHELGHCVLLRDHDETALNNGTCESLMRSGAQDCTDAYSAATRERYLNELFSENNS